MKLRITQAGFNTYNGQMGVINFENGLSIADVLPVDAVRMAAVMLCEWENGGSPSVAQAILDNAETSAPMFVSGAEGQHDIEAAASAQAPSSEPAVLSAPAKSGYTVEELSAVADADGIKGLRLIADPLGVKSNSIAEMITAIMQASQAPKG